MPTNHEQLKQLAPAMIRIRTVSRGIGQGILVPGGAILTAAHCVDWDAEGGMAAGDYYIQEIETSKGVLKVAPMAVEPVADIAMLGSLDDQVFPKEALEFAAFCEATKPVPIFHGDEKLGDASRSARTLSDMKRASFSVYLHKKNGTWVAGKVEFYREAPILLVTVDEAVEGGDSGGPVVNESGELIGIISVGGANAGAHDDLKVCQPYLALPIWASQKILAAQLGEE